MSAGAHARVYDQQSHDILDLNMIFEISISNYIKDAATIDDRPIPRAMYEI